ncbi:MAG TPA: class I SAM-dependent methyltransferase [Alphaproteobacteria bacterium]|nr:class I SAM-dependent methyltransferase [Alphaproteobacteria bacterium]
MIDRSKTHEVMARQTHDDLARAEFIVGLKRDLRALSKGNATAYAKRIEPDFKAKNGRAPGTVAEIGAEMERQPYYRLWSALNRTAQDMMWQAVESTIDHDLPRMLDAAERLTRGRNKMGSLELDPDFTPPPDLLVANIHCQPGGYMREDWAGDIKAGALYESGGNIYSLGTGIGAKDSKAGAVIKFLADRHPDFRPSRILDLGCSAGGASVGYAAHFPDAEVHAVDAGPAILRYAHARAEALGVAVHFHQMDVGALKFAEGDFDLVVSHNVMHEISVATLARMLAESHRVLRPGGIALHQDVPIKGDRTLFERYMFSWETRNNNEPFWEVFAEANVGALMKAAGFAEGSIVETQIPKLDGPGAWYVAMGAKSA